MREIKFKVWNTTIDGQPLHITGQMHHSQGYAMIKVLNHPYSTKRGYVPFHRFVMEQKLNRFLIPREELVHHIDGNRENNDESNLKLTTPSDHPKTHAGERNRNGQFLCQESIFNEIKFRLLNTNTGQTRPYSLQELISTTYRNGQFKFRGRFTGLKDKNGVEIYEGDIVKFEGMGFLKYTIGEVKWKELETHGAHEPDPLCWNIVGYSETSPEFIIGNTKPIFDTVDEPLYDDDEEVIGNIYSNPELLSKV